MKLNCTGKSVHFGEKIGLNMALIASYSRLRREQGQSKEKKNLCRAPICIKFSFAIQQTKY